MFGYVYKYLEFDSVITGCGNLCNLFWYDNTDLVQEPSEYRKAAKQGQANAKKALDKLLLKME